jgi:hypothetical protein
MFFANGSNEAIAEDEIALIEMIWFYSETIPQIVCENSLLGFRWLGHGPRTANRSDSHQKRKWTVDYSCYPEQPRKVTWISGSGSRLTLVAGFLD